MEEGSVPVKRRCSGKESGLVECAVFVLPYLTPSELANVSLTCKPLLILSHSITLLRASDASRTLEPFPVPFLNALDSPPYAHFLYTPSLLLPSSPPLRQPWGSPLLSPPPLPRALPQGPLGPGCHCRRPCLRSACPCAAALRGLHDLARDCGPACACGPDCQNRVARDGVMVKVKIVRHQTKGWGLKADQFIPKGDFLFHYAGELLTTKEAQRRHQYYDEMASQGRFSSALLVVREHLPSGKACLRLNIDATRMGNVARFVNHSCDGGNLSTKLVRSSGSLIPRLCFFASKDIQVDEELTFSYGETRKRPNGLPCFCNSPSCFGTLPSEDT